MGLFSATEEPRHHRRCRIRSQSETPGLGAEIATPAFQKQFVGKTLFGNGSFVGINVTKGVGSSAGNSHAVDAISGGTITSRAVQINDKRLHR